MVLDRRCPTLRQFHQHFTRAFFIRSFFLLAVKVKPFFAQEYWRNCANKMLVKLTPCRYSTYVKTAIFIVATEALLKLDFCRERSYLLVYFMKI